MCPPAQTIPACAEAGVFVAELCSFESSCSKTVYFQEDEPDSLKVAEVSKNPCWSVMLKLCRSTTGQHGMVYVQNCHGLDILEPSILQSEELEFVDLHAGRIIRKVLEPNRTEPNRRNGTAMNRTEPLQRTARNRPVNRTVPSTCSVFLCITGGTRRVQVFGTFRPKPVLRPSTPNPAAQHPQPFSEEATHVGFLPTIQRQHMLCIPLHCRGRAGEYRFSALSGCTPPHPRPSTPNPAYCFSEVATLM